MQRIYTGTNNFHKLLSESEIIADKSLFIKEIIDHQEDSVVIIRPRRWGKSMNFDMLKRFLNIEVNEKGKRLKVNPNRVLFEGGEIDLGIHGNKILNKLKIARIEGDYMNFQGESPVILLSLRECTGYDYKTVIDSLKTCISNLFEDYKYLLHSPHIDDYQKNIIKKYLERNVDIEELKESLSFLSRLLYKHFNKHVWVLIDEHDKPGSHFLTHQNFCYLSNDRKEVIFMISSMLARCGKDNKYVYRMVMTGVTDFITREGSSGFNNIKMLYDLKRPEFNDSYGLSELEVKDLVERTALNKSDRVFVISQLREWYNGYVSIDKTRKEISIYNIWSVMNHLGEVLKNGVGALPLSYWSNTGMQDVLENINHLGVEKYYIDELIKLSRGEDANLSIPSENFSFMRNIDNMNARHQLVNYLLINYGYLNVQGNKLVIPNKEVFTYFREVIIQIWLDNQISELWPSMGYNIGNLGHSLSKDLAFKESFMKHLNNDLLPQMKGGDKTEFYFSSLVGGIIEGYSIFNDDIADYKVMIEKSTYNKGRIDNIFYSNKPNLPVIIHEYKKLDKTPSKEKVKRTLHEALLQILEKNYMYDPISKISTHNNYNFKNIKLRGVLFIRDENTGIFSVKIEEKEIKLELAIKIVEYMKDNLFIKDKKYIKLRDQNIDKLTQHITLN